MWHQSLLETVPSGRHVVAPKTTAAGVHHYVAPILASPKQGQVRFPHPTRYFTAARGGEVTCGHHR